MRKILILSVLSGLITTIMATDLIIHKTDGTQESYNLNEIEKITFTTENNEGDMIYVEGGTFTMGDLWGDGQTDETPTHDVTVSSFYIGKYEVTQAEYESVMGTNPSDFVAGNHPVNKVNWYDAVEYCNERSNQEGLTPCYTVNGTEVSCNWEANGYRLPTEAEWEYAARSKGRDDRQYSGTNSVDNLGDYCWYDKDEPAIVGSKQPNDLGIYDMSGNAREWCWDWYGNDYYADSPATDPTGPASETRRIYRGGDYGSDSDYCRTSSRQFYNPSYKSSYFGFRIVRRP